MNANERIAQLMAEMTGDYEAKVRGERPKPIITSKTTKQGTTQCKTPSHH